MRNGIRWGSTGVNAARCVLVSMAMAGSAVAGFAQTTLSDAQVESNVLRALAGAPELANQAITTRTVYGTVTLSGSVTTEAARDRAETLASTALGVKKVVDELTLGNGSATPAAGDPHAGQVLQSDGTYAPAADPGSQDAPPAYQRNHPDADQALDQQGSQPGQNSAPAQADPGVSPDRRPLNGQAYPQQSYPQGYPPQSQGYPQQGYPQQGYPQGNQNYPSQGQYPQQSQPYPQAGTAPGYPPSNYPQQGYPQQNYPQQGYPAQGGYARPGYGSPVYAAPMDGGQQAGLSVTVPAGTLVRVRVNQRLASDHSQPGDFFDGVVVHDVVAGDAIAIPRGATVQGRVVDSKASGVLKGRGELSLELTHVVLAGKSYAVVSDQWAHNGGDKTIQTVNRTAGFGALGAVVGAVAGGGEGAAIGAGVGAAAGLGSSAASGRGQVVVPSEAVVTFHLAQPASVQTVSEQEMQRLAYGVPAAGEPRAIRPRPYPGPYGAPPYGYPY